MELGQQEEVALEGGLDIKQEGDTSVVSAHPVGGSWKEGTVGEVSHGDHSKRRLLVQG